MSDIKAVISDYGGVIINDTDPAIFRDISIKFDVKYGLVVSAIKNLLKKYQTGKMSDHDFWNQFSEKVERELPTGYENLWIDRYVAETRGNPGVLKILRKLKMNEYKLAVLSNAIPPHAQHIRKKHSLEDFDVVIFSCEVGMKKPDEAVYRLVLEKLGTPADTCIFIDDNAEYLKPARNIGMKTIHYLNAEQLDAELRKLKINL